MSDKELIMQIEDYHEIMNLIHKIKTSNTSDIQDQEDISDIEDLLKKTRVVESHNKRTLQDDVISVYEYAFGEIK